VAHQQHNVITMEAFVIKEWSDAAEK